MSNHSRIHTAHSNTGRITMLAVDFTARDGQTHEVLGPVTGSRLVASPKPRPSGDLHVAATRQGMAVCEAVKLELWAVAEAPRTYWATDGRSYFQVHHVPQRCLVEVTPTTAYGISAGQTETWSVGSL